jgi:hypothetical protein
MREKWITSLGIVLLGAGILVLYPLGLLAGSYLILSFPGNLLHGAAGIDDWLVAAFGLADILCILAGRLLLGRFRSAPLVTVAAVIAVFPVIIVQLTVGFWPFLRAVDQSDAPLYFGSVMIADGEGAPVTPVVLDPTTTLIKLALLALIAGITVFLLIRYFRREDVRALFAHRRSTYAERAAAE